MFDTPDFDTAVYLYEHDVRYQARILALHGAGVRNFILFKYILGNRLTLELKYGVTRFSEVVSRGSGLDTFVGNQIREINVQVTGKL